MTRHSERQQPESGSAERQQWTEQRQQYDQQHRPAARQQYDQQFGRQ